MSENTSNKPEQDRFQGLSELDKTAIKLSDELMGRSTRLVDQSLASGNLPNWIIANDYLRLARDNTAVRAIIEHYEIEDPDEFEKEFCFSNYRNERVKQDAQTIPQLQETLDKLPVKPGHAKVVVAREKPEQFWEHKVMAEIPPGTFIVDPDYGDGEATPDKRVVIYFDPEQTVCVEYNCQDLVKAAQEKKQVVTKNGKEHFYLYLPYSSPKQTMDEIFGKPFEADSGNKVEYYDDSTGKSRPSGSYIMGCISGVMAGSRRFKIPQQFLDDRRS